MTFADGFPLMLLSKESMDSLNERLVDKVIMDQFRPNIVVSGCPAFDEDTWYDVWIGDAKFTNVKPCKRWLFRVSQTFGVFPKFSLACGSTRCTMVTVDPRTGKRHPKLEPLKTLRT